MREWLGFWGRPWADPEAIRALRDRRVRKLVRHAWNNVPYYRRLLEAARVRPEEIRHAEDLKRLPISTKRERQRVPLEDKVARGVDLKRCVQRWTSGSTGQQDLVVRTRWEEHVLLAHRARMGLQVGVRPGYLSVNVGIQDTRRALPHRLGLFPITLLNPFLEPCKILSELVRVRPDFIRALPNILDRVVQEDVDKELRQIGTKIVFCGSEVMAPATWRRIEEGFGARIIDIYGAHEFNMIAWSCLTCGSYHTVDDSVYLEVLKDGCPAAPGEEGEVVVTGLHSFAMPFIRFDTGDIARVPEVRRTFCRISFGAVESLEGRACESITLSNGSVINPARLFRAVGGGPLPGRSNGARQHSCHRGTTARRRRSLFGSSASMQHSLRQRCGSCGRFGSRTYARIVREAPFHSGARPQASPMKLTT